MVKRLLTRLLYPLSLSIRSSLPRGIRCSTLPLLSLPPDSLGRILANRQLHSPLGRGSQGAASRDRQGFFFWQLRSEDGKAVKHLLVKSPPGLGKTTEAIKWAIRYRAELEDAEAHLSIEHYNEAGVPAQTSIFVPRHQLAEELREEIESAFRQRGEPITILRGRENGAEEGKAPCRRWREAHELARKGLPIYTNLCERKEEGKSPQCRYFAGCEYIQTRLAAYCSPFAILVHSHLGLEWGRTAEERYYEEEEGSERQRHFNPRQANIIICDEDPTVSLVERVELSSEDIRVVGEDGLGETILAGLVDPGGLLSYLRDAGVTADQLQAVAEDEKTAERRRGQITSPETGDGEVAQAANSAARLVRLSRALERLADEVECGRPGPAYSLLQDGDKLIAQGRRAWVFDNQRLLLLDGTANPDILRQFVPQLQDAPEIRVQRNARVIQVRDRTFFRHSLVERVPEDRDGARWRPNARLAEVSRFIERVARQQRTLVVTNKRVRCALTGENANGKLPVSGQSAGADIAHFGSIRGTNEFEKHDAVIILGREQLSPRDAERLAMAKRYDTKQPIQCIPADTDKQVDYPKIRRWYMMHDGSQQSVKVKVHPDRRAQAVVEQVREAEMVQAIDRLRLIHSERQKTVFILCNIPLSIPVDDLVTWGQLSGDNRLEDALAECEDKGWDALPLGTRELSYRFPELWLTPKTAEHWLRKNPLNSSVSIIRLWGVIAFYRPCGRRGRWSRALVRHGAEAQAALAGVLGLAAEDIRVRGCPD
jgi:hypothetical protein